MSDAIKAALEAALTESITDAWTLEGEHRQWALERAAATVAAFLRALDDGVVLRLLAAEKDKNASWRDTLAQAIERAAREGRDG
jgi:hypothetical protein